MVEIITATAQTLVWVGLLAIALLLSRVIVENIDRIVAMLNHLRRRKPAIIVYDAKGHVSVTGIRCSRAHFYAVLVMYVQHKVINKEILDDMFEKAQLEEKTDETPRS